MGLVEKDTFAGTVVNGTLTVGTFTEGWIINDGSSDLTITLANGNTLTLKPYEEQRWSYRNGNLIKGYTASGLATTFRYCYIV